MSPQSQTRRRIALVCPRVVSMFVSEDARALSDGFDVRLLPHQGLRGLWALGRAIRESDAVLIWFLGRHAIFSIIFAQLFRKPLVSIIGGFEVAWVPKLKYGTPPGSLREHVLAWMLNSSTRIIAVSKYSRQEALERFPHLASKLRLIYNSVDTLLHTYHPGPTRQGAISVGGINSVTIGRKSWPLFAQVAEKMPEISFVIVGNASDPAGAEFVRHLPPNVSWRGVLTRDALISELQGASVYFQASVHEAFCVAMVEAMACGCIPVIAPCAALPEIAGQSAVTMTDLSVEAGVCAVTEALARGPAEREAARGHIIGHFSFESRRTVLSGLFDEILGEGDPWPTS